MSEQELETLRAEHMASVLSFVEKALTPKREPKIQTSPIFPPIPIRSLDWCAHFDNYEPGQPIGHGATEQEAIEDLKEQVEK